MNDITKIQIYENYLSDSQTYLHSKKAESFISFRNFLIKKILRDVPSVNYFLVDIAGLNTKRHGN